MEKKFFGKVIGKTTEQGWFGTYYYVAVKLDSFDQPATTTVTFAQYCQTEIGNRCNLILSSADDGKTWSL